MKLLFWRKDEPKLCYDPAPRVETGIERHWREIDEQARRKAAEDREESDRATREKIAEIRASIAPQLAEIAALEATLTCQPWGYGGLLLHDLAQQGMFASQGMIGAAGLPVSPFGIGIL